MSESNRELDERVWQAWLDRNAKQDRKFFVNVKVGAVLSLVLAAGFLLWRLF